MIYTYAGMYTSFKNIMVGIGWKQSSKKWVNVLFDLMQWLLAHPKYLKNPLYIAGDSYAGIIVPVLVQEIANGNY